MSRRIERAERLVHQDEEASAPAVEVSACRRRRSFIEVLSRRAAGVECKVPPPRRNIRTAF
jgi:hypothetical protein